jgi:hypothetical protein
LIFKKIKKKKEVDFVVVCSLYGFFLSIINASTAPIMTMTTMTATMPYSKLADDARPVSGVAVGADVAGALITLKLVSSLDGQ